MTNEWLEFKAYIDKPTYFSTGKRDYSYFGRFSINTFKTLEGLGRILTVIARGYLFHDKSGTVLTSDAYSRIEYTQNALLAWCSLPDENDTAVNFKYLADTFPELVTDTGEGWFYMHIKGIAEFIKKNPKLVTKTTADTMSAISKNFQKMWKNKVKQMQVPPLALNTKGAWVLRFDDIIADALELGALRTEEYPLPKCFAEKLLNTDLNGVPFDVLSDVICYYLANKSDNTDWVRLPVASFDCYYQNTSFSKKMLSAIPETILQKENSLGVCRVKLMI